MSNRNVENVYPLSPMQEGLLFHSLYAPEGGVYVTQIVCEVSGLDIRTFARAWQRVIDRHAALRTAFVWKNVERPLQLVGRRVELPLRLEDWRDASPPERDARLALFLEEDRQRGFQFNKAPLLRVALFQTDADAHLMVLTHHHLVVDGWSMALVFKEVFELYGAFAAGREPRFEPGRSYQDYIAWLQAQDVPAAESFWRDALRGLTAPTPLPTDAGAATCDAQQGSYEEHQCVVAAHATSGLLTLARRQQLTLNTILQGAWALLLSRTSGEEEVVFGSVVAGRPAALDGVETTVGLFINTLPVRVRVPARVPTLAWLKQLQEQQVEAWQYDYCPLVEVQRWSEMPPGVPLFESIVSFQNFPRAAAEPGGRRVTMLRTIEAGNYPLALTGSVGEELSLVLRYAPGRFESATAARMLGHLRTLLEGIAADPARPLWRLPLLTEAERRRLLSEWSLTATQYPSVCVHEAFEQQVERTPDAAAVRFGDEQISYRELNRRANQLANHLRRLGVGAEVPVALCVERSIEMVVALLGILKAGGAYVPLDPAYPLERLAFLLNDTASPILLTQERLVDRLPAHWGQLICLDADWDEIGEAGGENPRSGASADSLAYVIYTSGSTGRPKGVAVTHRGVVRLVKETNFFDVTPTDVFLQLAPLSFDASTFEVWAPLLNGAALFVAPPHTPTLEELGDTLRRGRVTTLWLTAGLFHLMVDERAEDLSGVRQLLAGGDVLSPGHVRRALGALRGGEVINGYGPTENTTFTCCARLSGDAEFAATVPIGRPVSNTQVFILDALMRPVPQGVAGELYAGGDGLARGYHNRAELTAEKFVPHPFSAQPGARLYRTGDLVRYLPDGRIEFLGRADQQVKIHGFRIELGEIETALGAHAQVREAVVVARASTHGDKHLVGYYVPRAQPSPAAGELRDYLRERLPEYMVPTTLVELAALPLTVNGKVDVRALPLPGEAEGVQQATYIAPRGFVEETIAAVWSQVLGVERVGASDSFFDLGGHSIFAIQLLSRLNKTFNLELPLRVVYENPTLAELAAAVVEGQAEQSDGGELAVLLAELENISDEEARTRMGAEPEHVASQTGEAAR